MLLCDGRPTHTPEQKTADCIRQRGRAPSDHKYVGSELKRTSLNKEIKLMMAEQSFACRLSLTRSLTLHLQVSHKQMTQLILFSLLHQKQPARAIYDFKAQSAK